MHSKPIYFVVKKCSRTEKSPWIKRKTKPRLNVKKIDEFHSDRRQNLAESDKGSWLNELSEREAASASSLISAVSKKKIMESRRKQCYERATSTDEDYSSLSDSSLYALHFLNYAAALSPRFVFVLWKYVFFLLFCPWLTTVKTCASLNPRCGTCSSVCFCSDEGRRFRFVLPIVDYG